MKSNQKDLDPPVPNWKAIELPESWADKLNLFSLKALREFWLPIFYRKKAPVKIAEGVYGKECVPKYAQQEFHNLPNGLYSRRYTRGYITGFEISMLGLLEQERNWIAEALQPGKSFLDAGCSGGKTAAAIMACGGDDVWGLDPSPYVLKHANVDVSGVNFLQGVIEKLPFADARFDGVAVNFLFHEIPPRYLHLALAEISRVLKSGAKLAIVEPSPVQFYSSYWALLKQYGWRGVYFKWVASFMHEPFLPSWHEFDLVKACETVGLSLELDDKLMPVRRIVAIKK